uniref:Putative ovule protein n=1 Tax=Solanum chacoense TaxID=4108 RepID=A0A0V0H740_SOLCH
MFQKCSMSTILCAMTKCEKKYSRFYTNIYCLVLEARVQDQMFQKSWQNARKEGRKIGTTDRIIFPIASLVRMLN